jgi:hypothetical protein
MPNREGDSHLRVGEALRDGLLGPEQLMALDTRGFRLSAAWDGFRPLWQAPAQWNPVWGLSMLRAGWIQHDSSDIRSWAVLTDGQGGPRLTIAILHTTAFGT